MSGPNDVFIPIPDAPKNQRHSHHDFWPSEKGCHQWLLNVLYETPEMEVFDEPHLVDIYGNKARADIGVMVHRKGGPFFFVIELKHQVTLSTNAAAAFIQAYHYREMCVVADHRLPGWVNGRSPTFAFAGVFLDGVHGARHGDRCGGMGILSANMKVGNIWCRTNGDRLLFRSGDMRLFCLPFDGKTPIDWQTTADAYLFGGERRNGGRRDRQSVAEKFFEMQQSFTELF